jgi:hypothetical protein
VGGGILDRQRTDPAPSDAADAGEKTTPDAATTAATPDDPVAKAGAVVGRARRDAQRLALASVSGFSGPKPFSIHDHLYPADRPFDSQKPTSGDRVAAEAIDGMVQYARRAGLAEAAANAGRFRSRSGKNRRIDVRRLLRDDVNVAHRVLYDTLMDVESLLAAEGAFPGPDDPPYRGFRVSFEPFPFTDYLVNDRSRGMDAGEFRIKKRFFPEIEDEPGSGVDRDYLWGFGEVYLRRAVHVAVDPPENGEHRVALGLKLTAYDRYDWVQNDGKKIATDAGVTLKDALFVDLHATGLARNFDLEGSHTVRLRRTVPASEVDGYSALSDADWIVDGFRTDVGRAALGER